MSVNVQKVQPSKLLRGQSREIQGLNSHVGALKLRGDDLREKVDAEIIDVRLTRAIDVSSTVEVDLYDPDLVGLNSKLCKERVDVELDGLWFRSYAIGGSYPITTLRFEDREIARQRKHTGALKANRDKMTRAEFCVSLLLEAKPNPPIYCPELHVVQPIENASQGRQAGRETHVTRGKGLNPQANLTVKGQQANASQIKLADRMMRAAVSFGATNEVLQGLVCALINETTIQNLSYGDSTSTGPLQVLTSTAAAVHVDPRDPEGITKVFVQSGFTGAGGALELSKKMDVRQWLGLVMYSANGTPYPGLQYLDEAQKWVDAFGGGASGTITTTREKPYQFERKPNENTWTAVGRLMEEVRWLRFCSGGIIYLIAETDLLASKVRMNITPQTEGVDRITDYDLTIGKRNDELTVSAWVRNWAAPPGSVAELDGYGPLDGRYIVTSIGPMSLNGDAETRKVDITLKRPQKPLPEPAAETVTNSKSFDMGGGSSGGGDVAQQLVHWAESQVGVTEGSSRQIEYANKIGVSPSLPWCSVFVAYGLKFVCGVNNLPSNPAYSGAWLNWSGGSRVSVKSVQPGDLVIFDWGDGGITDHVAIYIGNGQVIGGNQSDAVTKTGFQSGSCVGAVRIGL